ncbi:serine/threonine-protein kinase LMTK1 [Apteryx mantelli]|uniref:Serine/threonine-protein kinase LMTK1 n=1 Tax=Apteryx mantelli TaxID=2696672 RepID=A0ABM4FIH1_9AVES
MGRLAAAAAAAAMSAAFLSPSLAFSSHFDPDGTPLSELSWSSSLAVVAVSFSGLFTFIFLMLACLCCKKGDIGFKEFENAEGDDYAGDFSAQGSPAPQHGPEVYVLPLTEVSLPMAKQPGRSVQLLKSADLGRQSLLYLKEIGHGWFGKVFLGEVNSGISSTQVVVKELKVSASVQDQMQFLEEAQPYRALQHTNLLQCLAQCAEVTPYLLVMEFCPLGDLKGYLRSCRGADSMAPDPLTLQRMACEVACGVLHLHRNNYIHSDLALRNCLLTADLTVKIGDYGLSHCKYKDDYFVTADQLWVPLRWIAPELIDEVHGNLLIVDQTKASNVWSLGVTIWELFELGSQPYDHYSDRQVLAYAIKEQQLKLPKPQLKLSLSERWYEVMQFCWLQPEQRPTAEEVHLLLSYLCAKGATEAEEEFEKRWNSMKPNGGGSGASHPGAELSSFPLLEQFAADGFPADGDDVLTVMETSHGLNFEYKWEHTKTEHFQAPLGALSPGSAARYHELYYPAASAGRLGLGLSPSCYACERQGCAGLPAPGVVPILGAHSPSLSSEYYIRIEGPAEGGAELDAGAYSPVAAAAAAASPGTEPLLGPAAAWEPAERGPYACRRPRPRGYEPPARDGADRYLLEEDEEEEEDDEEDEEEEMERMVARHRDWPVPGGRRDVFADPLGVSPPGKRAGCGEESPPPAPRQPWASNSSSNNNSGGGGSGSSSPPARQPAAGDSWCYRHMITFRGLMAKPLGSVPRDPAQPAGSPRGQAVRRVPPEQPPGEDGGSRPEPAALLGASGSSPSPPCLAWQLCDASVPGGDAGPAVPPAPAEPGDGARPAPEAPAPAAAEDGQRPEAEQTSDKTLSSASFPSTDDGSDEDTAELTSGVFTDFSGDYAERAEVAPAFKSLQKQVGTPDSLESLDIPSTASSCEGFSPTAFAPPGQPRALDSGYDTENNESPEFVLKEPHEPREPEGFSAPGKGGEGDGAAPETRLPSPPGAEPPGPAAKNPCRDSAYFSDGDAEAERGREDGDGSDAPVVDNRPRAQDWRLAPGAAEEPPRGTETENAEQPPANAVPAPGGSPSPGRDACPAVAGAAAGSVPPEIFSSSAAAASPEGVARGDPSASRGVCGLGGDEAGGEQTADPGPVPPAEGPCRSVPGGSLLLAALERREEPEEEEEDTEDSDESDEELRCYNIQEQSEESEDEPAAVPIVVAESHSARNLRSLLKMPSLLSASFCEDLERKKKAVSFFDDVTIYLFDQESPTRELGEQSFPDVPEPPGQPPASGSPAERLSASDDSSDGNASEESGGFEWDDDFPLVPVKASLMSSLAGTPAEPPPAVPSLLPAQKQVLPLQFSRFTVSPAPVSRFSITHVSDSDMDSVGGSSEDGDRE